MDLRDDQPHVAPKRSRGFKYYLSLPWVPQSPDDGKQDWPASCTTYMFQRTLRKQVCWRATSMLGGWSLLKSMRIDLERGGDHVKISYLLIEPHEYIECVKINKGADFQMQPLMCRLEEGMMICSFQNTVLTSMPSGPKSKNPIDTCKRQISSPFHFTPLDTSSACAGFKDVLCLRRVCKIMYVCVFILLYWFISLGSVSLPHHYFWSSYFISTFTMTL